MLVIGTILAAIGRVVRRYHVTERLSWNLSHHISRVISDHILPRAKRFLTLDITISESGEFRSVGLHLRPQSASLLGTRVYAATIVDQTSIAYSAWFLTDGYNCLIVLRGET